jgi:hypothetical protein
VNGTLTIPGGKLLAAGSSGMAVAPAASSTRGWVAATFGSAKQAGTVVHIVAADGTEIAGMAGGAMGGGGGTPPASGRPGG